MDTKYIIGFVGIIAVAVGLVAFVSVKPVPPGPVSMYDLSAFAQCLSDKGAKFYGAFWCPHCQATKKIFGTEATKKLPYIECSAPNTRDQLPVCIDKKIESYPTWEFADGSRLMGELSTSDVASAGMVSLQDLAQKSTCPLLPLPATPASNS